MSEHPILLVDLDDTLYRPESGVWEAISVRISQYIFQRLNLPTEEILPLRQRLYADYGTTLRGLSAEYGIERLDYLDYVHDLPLENYLSPDPALRKMFISLPNKKFIFTNADRKHAMRVLGVLRLEGIFDGIIDILDMDPHCKPMPESFKLAMQAASERDPGQYILVDDRLLNVRAALNLGFQAVWLRYNDLQNDGIPSITSLIDLPNAILCCVNKD